MSLEHSYSGDQYSPMFENSSDGGLSATAPLSDRNSLSDVRSMSARNGGQSGRHLSDLTYDVPGGGEMTVDGTGKVRQMTDAAGRNFSFDYDGSTPVRISNETGTWQRQRSHHFGHHYSQTWTNLDSPDPQNPQTWTGDVSISRNGYQFSNTNESVNYTPDGTRVREQRDGQGVARQRTTDYANGVNVVADGDNHKLQVTMAGDLKHPVVFSNFDQDNQPRTIQDQHGQWNRDNAETEWNNGQSRRSYAWEDQNGDVQHASVSLNEKGGSYSFTDRSGTTVTRHTDGTVDQVSRGIRSTWHPGNSQPQRSFVDGDTFASDPVTGKVHYEVRKGHTVSARVSFGDSSSGLDSTNDGAMVTRSNAPIGAFEAGHVVYSSADPGNISEFNIHGQALRQIRDMEHAGSKVCVVMTKDGRYQVYGLQNTNAQTGEWVNPGEVIGKVGDDGRMQFGIHLQNSGGPEVAIHGHHASQPAPVQPDDAFAKM